ncbi:sensor histidine kinase [Larkinella arboricola]|uniref:sensor histidine kinase n=1 Tax=Larkinella arboricola TaxID=643671 RepID=UPI001E48A85D|nr:HAMP domain-containing sensor histidine kinase [Larkinella arboricola]
MLEKGALSAADEQYLRTTQQRIKKELAISSEELQVVTQRLKEQNPPYTFAKLKCQTKHPYYIFRNKKLLFWSDHRFVPGYKRLKAVSYPKLVAFPRGDYLVSRQFIVQGADSLEAFSLINVRRSFRDENNNLRSEYNPNLFSLDPAEIKLAKSSVHQRMFDQTPVYLFSVVPPHMKDYQNQTSPVNTVIWVMLSVFFMGVYLIRSTLRLRRRRHYGAGWIILALYLIMLRAVMLYFGVPFLFFELDLFNPKYFGSSPGAPSLGDLLLNCLVVVVLALYLANTFYRTQSYYWLLRQSDILKAVVSVITVILSYGVFFICFEEIRVLYEKATFTLDITLSLSYSSLKLACLLVFIGISTAFFLLQHVLSSLFIRLNLSYLRGLLWFGIGSVLAALFFWQLPTPMPWLLGIQTLFFMVLYLSRFPRALYTFRFKTTLYLFFAAFVCAAIATFVVYNQGIQKDLVNKREFGEQLLVENDAFGEFALNRSRTAIRRDTVIVRALTSDTVSDRDSIELRVKSHLDKYFERYTTEVRVFPEKPRLANYQNSQADYTEYAKRFRQEKYRTQYQDIYFISGPDNGFRKHYVQFIDIRKGNVLAGHIVLDLKLDHSQFSSLYHEPLTGKQFVLAPETQTYAYAVYDHNKKLLYSNSGYNYERQLSDKTLTSANLYETGAVQNNFKHVGIKDGSGRIVIVSSKSYPARNILSNFSFLYLVLIVFILTLIVVYTIRFGLSRFYINYSTKTQLYLNVAFFLPMALVVAITFGVTSANYKDYQENSYLTDAKNVSVNILGNWVNLQAAIRQGNQTDIEAELQKITPDEHVGISIYNREGRLTCSTQPLLYANGNLSKRINPAAYIDLVEEKDNQVLLLESLGAKRYKTVYTTIQGYDGQLLGILAVSHFDSESVLERQMIDVVTTALSVFIGLFLVFLLVSYWASNLLTKPLKIITQKIRKINLDRLNEPLDWKSDDEIGLLIGEYNRMLVKLEEKKQALSQSEKQSAWREMAKQVAHEIKNPLTPMKLTLQHLQRTLQSDNPAAKRVLQRTLDTLLDQIDNLSAIATSFSDFAKMPLPKNELFELTSVIHKAADLYADDGKITLIRDISPYPVMVMGDRQLIGRILTNLIINSVQSVSEDRKPIIHLRLSVNEEYINIEISDNGAGVPEPIRNKIFLPNFSTKEGGSGLGLAIAKRGIEHAGGSIWFETETGEGTTFFITLPHILSVGAGNGLQGEGIGQN